MECRHEYDAIKWYNVESDEIEKETIENLRDI